MGILTMSSRGYSMNILAAPKVKDFLRCFVAPDGHELGQLDLSAVEPTVLSYLSKDPNLLKVFGDNTSQHHDIYFMAGLGIPGIRELIAPYYNTDNPDPELMKECKEKFGDIRKKKLKPCYLGWTYGIGPDTLSTNLKISFNEASKILEGLNNQFKGRNWLHQYLLGQWGKNGGWIINGRGRPIGVSKRKIKDLVSQCVQSTGHDFLQRLLYHMNTYRIANKLPMWPFIPDIHDETVWAVKLGYREEFVACSEYAFDQLNNELKWQGVKIKHGGINFGADLRVRCD